VGRYSPSVGFLRDKVTRNWCPNPATEKNGDKTAFPFFATIYAAEILLSLALVGGICMADLSSMALTLLYFFRLCPREAKDEALAGSARINRSVVDMSCPRSSPIVMSGSPSAFR
jgi:hypothetical protein